MFGTSCTMCTETQLFTSPKSSCPWELQINCVLPSAIRVPWKHWHHHKICQDRNVCKTDVKLSVLSLLMYLDYIVTWISWSHQFFPRSYWNTMFSTQLFKDFVNSLLDTSLKFNAQFLMLYQFMSSDLLFQFLLYFWLPLYKKL